MRLKFARSQIRTRHKAVFLQNRGLFLLFLCHLKELLFGHMGSVPSNESLTTFFAVEGRGAS